mmetsp:Transcript_11849/g.22182  ORF Transcript_11849/g.22182 Transcript_11849/m.22182 type:complete len:570 (+) Transcript_11849:64-1773(+)
MIVSSLPLPIPKNDPQYVYTVENLNQIKPLISQTVTHPAIIVPAKLTSSLRTSVLKPFLLNIAKIRDVYPLEACDELKKDGDHVVEERKIVLKYVVDDDDDGRHDDTDQAEAVDDKDKERQGIVQQNTNHDNIFDHPTIQQLLNDSKYPTIRKSSHDITIGYDHFTVDQVLSKILPLEHLSEIPSSFEVIGHLAHITLREEYYPYKYMIGRIILDKNKGIKVVVNKTGTIQNEFRTFPMEILADDRRPLSKNSNSSSLTCCSNANEMNLLVEVREDGCRFQLDFEKVYWNSRLQYEHKRIVHLIGGKCRTLNVEQRKRQLRKEEEEEGDDKGEASAVPIPSTKKNVVVADTCAGIGPFAIPLTSQYDHVEVHANDLNPESYRYLNINAKLNKCHKNNMLHTYNMDARYFLRMLDEKGIVYDHVLMNLPAIAPEFLNVFRGWKGGKGDGNRTTITRPMIHVHCFAAKVGGEVEAVERCGKSLGCELDMERDEVSVHQVRNVSPKKNMYCVSFRLPEAVKDVEFVQEFRQEHVTQEEEEEEVECESKKEIKDPKDEYKEEESRRKKSRIDT